MNWRFWMKICVNNSIEDDKQVSLTPALLNRDNENDGCFQAIICQYKTSQIYFPTPGLW